MRHIIVGLSDSHGGHRLGLLQPDTLLPREAKDGGLYYKPVDLSECQRALYDWQEGCIEWITKLAGSDPITLAHLGDMAHGNGHATELVSTRMADQIIIAKDNLLRWMNGLRAKRAILCVGTDVHEFMEGSASVLIRELAGRGVEVYNHALLDVEGYTLDIAHHGAGSGSRVWLRGNVARYYAQSLALSDIVAGHKPPNLIWRGHVHDPIDEVVSINGYKVRMLICPPMCFPGAYALKVTRSVSAVSFGVQVLEIIDGKLAGEPQSLVQKIDLRQQVRI